jgi:tetratricopeptide (TPR) repeat protein
MSEAKSPQILAEEGKSAYQNGDYANAASLFEAAQQGYQTAEDALMAAEMANNASVAYLQGEDAEAALKAVEGTAALFAQASDLRRQGMALGNYAAALEALERNEEAAEYYQQSADVLQQAGEDQLRSNVLHSLSALQFRTGRQLQALASMQAGLEGVKKPNPRQRLLKRLLQIPFNMLNKGQKKTD